MMNFIKRNPLPVVLFTIFLDMLGYGILIPIIPQLFTNPASREFLLPAGLTLKQGYVLLGFLLASFPLAQFFATPVLGQLSDRFGRKKILAISLAGTCASYFLFGIGIIYKNLPLLFVSRFFDGLTGGNIAVAQAAIADVTQPKDRAKNFGLIGAAFGLGFIIGPYLGGRLSDPSVVSWFNAATPFWFAGILSMLNVISVITVFPETLLNIKSGVKIAWNKAILNIIKAFNFDGLRVLYTSIFLFQGGFSFFIGFFSVYLINKFGFTQGQTGDFFAYVGIWIAITQALITRNAAKYFKEFQIVRVTMVLCGITLLTYFLPNHSWQLYLVAPFFAIFNGLTQANLVGLVSRSVGPEIQGEILGINSSIQAFAQSIPPMLSGFIAQALGPATPIFTAGTIIIFAGLIFAIMYQPVRLLSPIRQPLD